MPTVLREDGLRVVVYPDDHAPPHVHVFGDDETKIILGNSPSEIVVISFGSAKRAEERRAARLVAANHAALCVAWRKLHG